MWTVYERPSDFPEHYVARRFEISKEGPVPSNAVVLAPDLDLLRGALMDMGLSVRLERNPEDEAQIVETWM
jgi:hypothetical protein